MVTTSKATGLEKTLFTHVIQGAHTGLTKSYKVFICFSVCYCEALQSLILGVFLSKMSHKV